MRRNGRETPTDSYTDSDFRQGASLFDHGSCTAVIGSMTQAMKAQSALSEAAIRATVVKVSSTRTHNGCAYGVDFPCTRSGNVQTVLTQAGVKVREYLKG